MKNRRSLWLSVSLVLVFLLTAALRRLFPGPGRSGNFLVVGGRRRAGS